MPNPTSPALARESAVAGGSGQDKATATFDEATLQQASEWIDRAVRFEAGDAGELCMLLVYPKAEKHSIPGHILKQIRKELKDDNS